MAMERLIIDTDPGIDDAGALFWALSSDAFQIEALTTVFGNVRVETATANARKIAHLAGRPDLPIWQGSARPLVGEPHYAEHIHRPGGVGYWEYPDPAPDADVPTDAVLRMIDTVMSSPGEVTIMALAPLTNVALAIKLEPAFARSVRRIIYMGGAALTWGNVTPVASANIYNDPEAAEIVIKSGAPLTQVGLDVSRSFALSPDHVAALWESQSPMGRALCEMIGYPDRHDDTTEMPEWKTEGMHLNDVPCVAYALNPDWFTVRHLHVDVELHGEHTRGQTVVQMIDRWQGEPNVDVLFDIDGQAVADALCASVIAFSDRH
ncbi:nucleoside hydrolase [Microbacterium sp. EST19A]|uniref:nucleoside hydrolase n=1 Tax=Microbacterium sp. EST19A TaxID=2862681 RepID=UPI001CBFCCE4|nr:nucleoside hydrolase [Microbacterium sp. EST19A]